MRWKWIIGIFALVLVVIVVTVYAILATYDFNDLKIIAADTVKETTGREMMIGGDIKLDIGLTPSLVAKNISFQNADWGTRPEMVHIKRLEVQVDLLPLIRGDISIKRFVIIEPDILIETDKKGLSNIIFKQAEPGTQEEKATSEGDSLLGVTVNRILIEKGRFTYRDGESGKMFVTTLDRLSTMAPDAESPLEVEIRGSYNNNPFEVAGTLGPLLALADPERESPLNLKAKAGGASLGVEGKIKDLMNGKGLALQITGEGKSTSDLAQLADAGDVPEMGPFSLAMKISDASGKTYQLSDLKISIGSSDIKGSLGLDIAGKRPKLTAVLSSEKLDLRSIATKDKGEAKKGTKGQGKSRKKVFPNDPLPLDALKQIDADLSFRVKKLLLPRVAVRELNLEADLNNGRFVLKPLKGIIGGGSLKGHLEILPKGKGVFLTTNVKVEDCKLGEMLKEIIDEQILDGQIELELDARGRGNSVAEMMAGLNGKIVIVMGKGRINNKYIELAGGDLSSMIFRLVNPSAEKMDFSVVNCLVTRFDIKRGMAKSTALVFDTDIVGVVGDGTVNLKNERLNMSIRPSPKKGLGGGILGKLTLSLGELAKPLRLAGTLSEPSLALDPNQTTTTLGKSVGGLALFGPAGIAAALAGGKSGDENPCVAAIEAARKGVKVSGSKKQKKEKKGSTEKPLEDIPKGLKDAVEGLKKLFGN